MTQQAEILAGARAGMEYATGDDERAEVIEELITRWYTAWPTAATVSLLAREIVRLLGTVDVLPAPAPAVQES